MMSTLTIFLLNEVNFPMVTTVVSLIVATVGVVFGCLQYSLRKKEMKQKASDQLRQTLNSNPDIMMFFRKIDYSELWYENFHDSSIESSGDKMFRFFEEVLLYKKSGTLKDSDFKNYEYLINKIVMDRSTQAYFFNLYHYTKKLTSFPYQNLLDYGVSHNYIDFEEFKKENSTQYPKVLNF